MLFKSVLTSALLALSLGSEAAEATGRLSKLARAGMRRAEQVIENARGQTGSTQGQGKSNRFLSSNTTGEYSLIALAHRRMEKDSISNSSFYVPPTDGSPCRLQSLQSSRGSL